MNDLKQLSELVSQIYHLSNKINNSDFENLANININLLNKINFLEDELSNKNKELDNFRNKYDQDIKIKNEELTNLTKISFVQSLNKQLNDKNLIIQQLENQISKLKTSQNKELVVEIKKEPVVEIKKEPVVEIKKEPVVKIKKEINTEFNIDNFEDVNGFELIFYKKIYYLRDLETNELYDIVDYKPGKIIGLLNSKGKIKFN